MQVANNNEEETGDCNAQECTEECVGGASYIGPNTDPGSSKDYSGCAAYSHGASRKEKCNKSYQWMPRVIILNAN